MTKHMFFTAALTLAVACGGKTANDTLPAAASHEAHEGGHEHEAEHEHEGGHEHEHEHGGHGPVHAFHEQLAPLWHAPPGAQRVTDTCNAAGTLHGLAADIVKAGPPAGAAADYATAAQALVDACAALHAECGTARHDFDAKFTAVHNAFHALAERAPKPDTTSPQP